MIDITTIGSAMMSLKTAKDIAEAMITLRDGAAFQAKVIEFQSKIADAQSAIFAVNEERTTLIERVRNLEKVVTDMKAWESEKEKYELVNLLPKIPEGNGVFAYARKEGMEPSEPGHKICAECYQNGKKSVLQLECRIPGLDRVLVCNACGSELYIAGARHPEHAKSRRR